MDASPDGFLDYDCGDVGLRSSLFLPPGHADGNRRPAVLLFPEWWGVNRYLHRRSRQLTDAGYVVLAADMYGSGRVVTDVAEAARLAQETRTGPQSRARSTAAWSTLRHHPTVDPERVATVGFCFGGSVALELARSGVNVAGVVAFHAGLLTAEPATPGSVKASVLVLLGADDPHVPPWMVEQFQQEMRGARADWQLVSYGGAVHSFSNPDADAAGLEGVAYDARAERRAWRLALDFLEDVNRSPMPPPGLEHQAIAP